MNKVVLIGRLTSDPVTRTTSIGDECCHFSIVVNRNYSGSDGERGTDFFNVTAWRGLGKAVSRYAQKGNKVAVLGSIELHDYEDSQGVKRRAVDIIAQDVEFLSPRGGAGSEQGAPAKSSGNRGEGKPVLQSFDDNGDIFP